MVSVFALLFSITLPVILEILRRRLRRTRNEEEKYLTAVDAFIDGIDGIKRIIR